VEEPDPPFWRSGSSIRVIRPEEPGQAGGPVPGSIAGVTVPVRARFAPSPTGYLHLGSARTALFNWLLARHTGGAMLLRIEDTDAERSKPELVDLIFRTLDWLGIDWDEDVEYQSRRADEHVAAVNRLLDAGLAYRCSCTRGEVETRAKARGGKPGYDGYCRDRDVASGPGVVVRFRTPDEGATAFADIIRGDVSFPNADLEDFVILRANGTAMFLVANAVDDVAMGVTHVVRGEDLLNVTPKVLLLRHALGTADDPVFAHLPLIVNEKRQKLSKRRDDVAVEDYVARGYLPEAMVNYLATLGWGPTDGVEIRPLAEIIELFELEAVSKSSAFFDIKKLNHFNGEYIRRLDLDAFIERVQPWLHGDAAPWPEGAFDAGDFAVMAPLVQERVTTLSETPGFVDFLFLDEPVVDEASWQKVMVKGRDTAVTMLDGMLEAFASCDWTVSGVEQALFGFGEARGIKRGQAQAPVRVAVTGRSVGPPLLESIVVLGRERTLSRVRAARARL
jgi:glutamyl-tRNA synthetase